MRKLVIAAFLSLFATASHAATVDAGGTSSGDCTFGCTPTFQQLYRSDLFGTDPVEINTVSTFQYLTNAVTGVWDMYLSTSPSSVGSISGTFADNRGGDYAYFGSLGPTDAGDMGLLTFSGSFMYDPSAGDLLVEWVLVSGAATGANYAAFGTGDLSRVYSFSAGATTGTVGQDYGIATQFGLDVSAVPLPAAAPLFGAVLAVFGLIGWRRKRLIAA